MTTNPARAGYCTDSLSRQLALTASRGRGLFEEAYL